MPGMTRVPFVCPRDGGALEAEGEDFLRCIACRRRFGVVAGIADLRLRDPGEDVSWEQDVARARELVAEPARRSVASDLAEVERSAASLDALARERRRPIGESDHVLELGCGIAGPGAAATRQAGDVVTSDVSLRRLVLARRWLLDAGLDDVRLACFAPAEPPFAPASFDVVLASVVIEHVPDQRALAAGAARMLAPGGTLVLRARARRPYDHLRLLWSGGLRRLLAREGLRVEVVARGVPSTQRRLAPVRAAMALVGPCMRVVATKD